MALNIILTLVNELKSLNPTLSCNSQIYKIDGIAHNFSELYAKYLFIAWIIIFNGNFNRLIACVCMKWVENKKGVVTHSNNYNNNKKLKRKNYIHRLHSFCIVLQPCILFTLIELAVSTHNIYYLTWFLFHFMRFIVSVFFLSFFPNNPQEQICVQHLYKSWNFPSQSHLWFPLQLVSLKFTLNILTFTI